MRSLSETENVPSEVVVGWKTKFNKLQCSSWGNLPNMN